MRQKFRAAQDGVPFCARLATGLPHSTVMRHTRRQFSAEQVTEGRDPPQRRGYDANMGTVRILRVYEEPEPGEYRVLVDRLWPRGIKKGAIDLWLKEAGPSTEVRNAFGHQEGNFEAFVRDYTAELGDNPAVEQLRKIVVEHEKVVLLYGAKDHHENQAAVLLDFLNNGS